MERFKAAGPVIPPPIVRSRNAADAQHPDVIYILGPNSDPKEIDLIRNACKKKGLSLHVVGDGERLITESNIQDLHRSKQLGSHTHIFVSGHGSTATGRHTILGHNGQGAWTTTRLITMLLTDPAGVESARLPNARMIHLLSCEAGSLKNEFTRRNEAWAKGSCLIHASTKIAVTGTMLPNAEAVISLLGDCKKRGLVALDPQYVFASVAEVTGECITLLGGELTKAQTWHAPKDEVEVAFQNAAARAWQEDLEKKIPSQQRRPAQLEDHGNQSHTDKRQTTFLTRIRREDIKAVQKFVLQYPSLAQAKGIDGSNPLVHAVVTGRLKIVSDLIEGGGAQVNAMDPDGQTALHYACEVESLAIAKFLVQSGADVNSRTTNNVTPLSSACGYGNVELAKLLLRLGANPNVSDVEKLTPLIAATMENSLELVTLLLKYNANCNAIGMDGDMALHEACYGDHSEIVKRLLKSTHIDKNIKNDCGLTPLFVAVEEGFTDVAVALIESGADIDVPNPTGRTVFHQVCAQGQDMLANLLLQSGRVHINSKASDGETPLSLACAEGRENYVACLVNWGADVNLADRRGRTPLMHASIAASPKTVQGLIDAKAELNTRDEDGFTALMHACHAGAPEAVQKLIDAKANLDVRDAFGFTALMHACYANVPETIQKLIDAKADLNVQDIKGFTALMHVCRAGAHETVAALVRAGAVASHRNFKGKTAADLAKEELAMTIDRGVRIDLKVILDLLISISGKEDG